MPSGPFKLEHITDWDGMVEYMATFQITKPIDMSKASHLMWHDVPNRSGRITIVPAERNLGDVGLSSGWQGDASGATAPKETNDYVVVPVAHNPDGSPVTGAVLGRIMNAKGAGSQTIYVHANPIPYKPFTLDTTKAKMVTHTHETMDGKVEGEINSAGVLTVGENAEIRGEIKTKSVTVFGKVHGNITVAPAPIPL